MGGIMDTTQPPMSSFGWERLFMGLRWSWLTYFYWKLRLDDRKQPRRTKIRLALSDWLYRMFPAPPGPQSDEELLLGGRLYLSWYNRGQRRFENGVTWVRASIRIRGRWWPLGGARWVTMKVPVWIHPLLPNWPSAPRRETFREYGLKPEASKPYPGKASRSL